MLLISRIFVVKSQVMATILDKDLTRESTVKSKDREIIVTLTADQRISLKLKGMKSGTVSIGIDELLNHLEGETPEPAKAKIQTKKSTATFFGPKDERNPVISLYALRAENAITHMPLENKLYLEKVLCDLLNREVTL